MVGAQRRLEGAAAVAAEPLKTALDRHGLQYSRQLDPDAALHQLIAGVVAGWVVAVIALVRVLQRVYGRQPV